jgi:hypothetical protein
MKFVILNPRLLRVKDLNHRLCLLKRYIHDPAARQTLASPYALGTNPDSRSAVRAARPP